MLAAGMAVRVARLPLGDDPDSLLRTKGPEAFQACLDAGMNAHIAKPFQPEQLLKMLRKYLGGR